MANPGRPNQTGRKSLPGYEKHRFCLRHLLRHATATVPNISEALSHGSCSFFLVFFAVSPRPAGRPHRVGSETGRKLTKPSDEQRTALGKELCREEIKPQSARPNIPQNPPPYGRLVYRKNCVASPPVGFRCLPSASCLPCASRHNLPGKICEAPVPWAG